MAENLAELPGLKEGQEIIKPMSDPIKSSGHLQVNRPDFDPKQCSAPWFLPRDFHKVRCVGQAMYLAEVHATAFVVSVLTPISRDAAI